MRHVLTFICASRVIRSVMETSRDSACAGNCGRAMRPAGRAQVSQRLAVISAGPAPAAGKSSHSARIPSPSVSRQPRVAPPPPPPTTTAKTRRGHFGNVTFVARRLILHSISGDACALDLRWAIFCRVPFGRRATEHTVCKTRAAALTMTATRVLFTSWPEWDTSVIQTSYNNNNNNNNVCLLDWHHIAQSTINIRHAGRH